MDIALIAGLWLDASAWESVVPVLEGLGHRPVALCLPGQGRPPPGASLTDQRDAVVAAIDAAAGRVMVVGHSAASTLAWMGADAKPDKVARAVMIGGFPSSDGSAYADFFPVLNGNVPFPGWERFEGADAADLDAARRRAFEAMAVTVPEAVAKSVVRYADERRFDVPVTLVCPEFSPREAKEWIDSGEIPELTHAKRVDFVDIDSGHWPMFTKPAELAGLLGRLADD